MSEQSNEKPITKPPIIKHSDGSSTPKRPVLPKPTPTTPKKE